MEAKIKDLNGSRPRAIWAGVYDGMSAKVAELCGFDGLWASGYSISAAAGIPDAGILSMTDMLLACEPMIGSTSLPVIADCDSGYGDARTVAHLVRRSERSGLAGICIEDNAFPKRCSLYGESRPLLSPYEHAQKVAAAKSAQTQPDFIVIARTEALVQKLGLSEALMRANAYADAGADAILIHSIERDASQVLAFAAAWRRNCPLIAVPTTYDGEDANDLFDAGFSVVVFANQALRAAVAGMRTTLAVLHESKKGSDAAPLIASVAEVNALVGVDPVVGDQDESHGLRVRESTIADLRVAG